tara:strand:- start:2428 stop:3201 length:774 start_codon:yes stop_codon:yes gene_type:complete
MAVNIDLTNQSAIVFGVANHRSIAWAIAMSLAQAGAEVFVTYQNERMGRNVLSLVEPYDHINAIECDVLTQESVEAAIAKANSQSSLTMVVHSVAFANKEDLEGAFSSTSIDGFRMALEVSAYSLLPIVKAATAKMPDGGSIVTLTFHAADKVYPGYNIMGVAKAALENEVKQLAAEYGPQGIRVNAVSAGPLNTLAARGISGFTGMHEVHATRAPLKRNITQEEVGSATLFLLSQLASGITGHILYVDAGYNVMGV